MLRINVLSEDTSNKIAAGEVVEKPFSVVKELIENSIDAGSKNISIEILEGGQKSIKILDDGMGIHPDDIEKAFMPHATSKISSITDVYNINTLGFRGEALASIGAVSNTVMRSRTAEFDYGREVSISGGKVSLLDAAGMNIGTIIEVQDLFYNVPARLKFLKSPMREGAYISDIISRLAMAHCQISFKFFSNGKKTLQTYGNGVLLDCIRNIYGKTTSENLVYFEAHTDIASVHGYIGNAEISRGSRNNQTIFVNGRYIKSRLITAAVENAFKSFLTINKYPFFVLNIDIFPEFIDVNIHPTKSEIKFMDDRAIFKLVFDCVHNAIRASLKESFDIPPAEAYIEEKVKIQEFDYFEKADSDNKKKTDINIPIDLISKVNMPDNCIINEEDASFRVADKNKVSNDLSVITTSTEVPKVAKFPVLQIIGQFNKTYILAQSGGDLYIIDQHAAHEKIIFEKYTSEILHKQVSIQILLTPMVVELSADDYLYYIENEKIFESTGFATDIFGDNSITIREVPYILGKLDVKNLFLSIIDNLKNLGSAKTIEIKYEAIAKMACKKAIKANNALSIIEQVQLLEDLRFVNEPFTCPHGRPTIIKITLYELEKKFKRVQ